MGPISCPQCGAETPNVPGFTVIDFCNECGVALPQSELGPNKSAECNPDDKGKHPIGIFNAVGIVVLGGMVTGGIFVGLVGFIVGDIVGGAMVGETGRNVGFIVGGTVGGIGAAIGVSRHNDEARR